MEVASGDPEALGGFGGVAMGFVRERQDLVRDLTHCRPLGAHATEIRLMPPRQASGEAPQKRR